MTNNELSQPAEHKSTDSFIDTFVNRLLLGMLIFAVIGLPISLSRWPDTGFLLVYGQHILLAISTVIFYYSRQRLTLNVRAIYIICFLVLIGFISVANFGLAGVGLLLAIICGYFCHVIWGSKIAMLVSSLYIVTLIIFAYMFINGFLDTSIDLNVYNQTLKGWLMNIVATILISLMLLWPLTLLLNQQLGLIDKIEKKNDEIERLANHDTLTGLPSLRLAYDRLDLAIAIANRNKSKSALLYIDLDGFKPVNDTYGHHIGDETLKAVAKRLSRIVRGSDTCCRIGGDEFIIILPDLTELSSIEEKCQALIRLMAEPLTIEEHSITVGLSIGVAVYPNNALDSDALRKAADNAMYHVKKTGKSNYHFA